MDLNDFTIIIDGMDKTRMIATCEKRGNFYYIKFTNNDKIYSYSIKTNRVRIFSNNVKDDAVFTYFKEIAKLNPLKDKKDGNLLLKKYNSIRFVPEESVLKKYLNASINTVANKAYNDYIFPFGANNSQIEAVKNAFKYQVSIIEGPPGTGKTQTILNIIANIIKQGKTVQIVSYNNSAIDNVYDKLKSNNINFMAAVLGKKENKDNFVNSQNGKYPMEISAWHCVGDISALKKSVNHKFVELHKIFSAQVELAKIESDLKSLQTEKKYFESYLNDNSIEIKKFSSILPLSSKRILRLLDEYQSFDGNKKWKYVLFCSFCALKYRVMSVNFWKQNVQSVIASLQNKFYEMRKKELEKRKEKLVHFLDTRESDLLQKMCDESLDILKETVWHKYAGKKERTVFSAGELQSKAGDFLNEYPIVLSTTFSALSCLGTDTMYDYVIMDEASQVDVATGALSLFHAKNAVIVGDSKQLPNVVDSSMKKETEKIFQEALVKECFRYTHSFLQSVKMQLSPERCVLLKEHYRCHPRIIEFCNKKFYHDELAIMTQDNGEDDVLKVIMTKEGNHCRNRYNQREIDVILNDILYNESKIESIGVISPYRNQVNALQKQINNVEIDTVHKFQGREKDFIIISTVDNQIADFVDDANMLNVAVSRAKKRLYLVTNGNKHNMNGNINDLISYIRYNNFEVSESKISSIFDCLYSQYTKQRQELLKKHKDISEYPSECIMYDALLEILAEDEFSSLEVVCHLPMNMLINDYYLLNVEERKYATNPLTHIDFVIVNKLSKLPVLLIEVDGVAYHQEGTKQAERDKMKNSILEKYQLPLLRLRTDGSEEREKIVQVLRRKENQ